MNFFIFTSGDDEIFPPEKGLVEIQSAFGNLTDPPTIRYNVTADHVGHLIDCRYTKVMMDFIRDGNVTSIEDYRDCGQPVIEYLTDGALAYLPDIHDCCSDENKTFLTVAYDSVVGAAVALVSWFYWG